MEVIILAGGLGTRLRSVVSDVPKCMAPVDGKPFLWYLLEHLRLFNVTHVILSVGYLRESVQDWVERHKGDYPFRFSFAVEEEPLGTGGGIALASSMVHGREAVVLNGDTFFDADLDELLELRRSSGRPVALALKKMRSFDRYGTVELSSEGLVIGFREKQYCAEGFINGGVYALDLEAGVFDGLEGKFSFERDVLEPFCARGLICGSEQSGYFLDIGIPADYSRAVEKPRLLHHPCDLLEIVQMAEGFETLLLDRDGVINRLHPGDYIKEPGEFEWLPGVKEALREAVGKFRGIYIVSNQRGVGRGIMSRAALDSLHSWMLGEIAAAGGRIDGLYICTAVSEDDPRRKPQTGMFEDLMRDHPGIDPDTTLMVGDSPSDRLFARRCGIAFYMVRDCSAMALAAAMA